MLPRRGARSPDYVTFPTISNEVRLRPTERTVGRMCQRSVTIVTDVARSRCRRAAPTRDHKHRDGRRAALDLCPSGGTPLPATHRPFNIGWWSPWKIPFHQPPPNNPERKIQSIGNGRRVGRSVDDGETDGWEQREQGREQGERVGGRDPQGERVGLTRSLKANEGQRREEIVC